MSRAPTAPLTVLYDEHCRFCTAVAAWLARRGRGLAVAPIGSPTGERLLRDLQPHERYATVHAVDELGRRRSGGDAVPAVLARLRGGRLPAALAAAFPRATAWGYGVVARNRSTLSRLIPRSQPESRAFGRRLKALRRASRGRSG